MSARLCRGCNELVDMQKKNNRMALFVFQLFVDYGSTHSKHFVLPALGRAERRLNPEGPRRLGQGLSPALISDSAWALSRQHTQEASEQQFKSFLMSVCEGRPLAELHSAHHAPVKVITACCYEPRSGWSLRDAI